MNKCRAKIRYWWRRRYLSLNFKLIVAVLVAAVFAVGGFLASSVLEDFVAEKYYLSDKARAEAVGERYRELKAFVKRNHVRATDTRALQKWVAGKSYTQLLVWDNNKDVFSGGWIVDSSDTRGAQDGSLTVQKNRARTTESDTMKHLSPEDFKEDVYNRYVTFADGTYYTYINVNGEKRWYYIMDIVAILIAAVLFLMTILIYNSRVLERVSDLSDAVRKISEGDLNRRIVPGHRDEIGELAASVDVMRTAILEKMGNEKAAWDANTQLITSMSHDIRTPLTSLIGYLDIIESGKFESREELDRYIGSCREKAFQLKDLSDRLFRYFLVFGKQEQEIRLERMDAGILFQQLLVEHVAETIGCGFNVNLQYNVPEGFLVDVDISSMRRLFDNLFSNIMKYADHSFSVEIKADLILDRIKLVLQNHIHEEAKKVESTKIGVRTCKRLCEDMNGAFHAMEEEKIYTTEILFPVVEMNVTEDALDRQLFGTAEASPGQEQPVSDPEEPASEPKRSESEPEKTPSGADDTNGICNRAGRMDNAYDDQPGYADSADNEGGCNDDLQGHTEN